MSDRHPDEPCQGETAKATISMHRLAARCNFVRVFFNFYCFRIYYTMYLCINCQKDHF